MKYHLKGKYRLKVNAFLVKQFKIWCSVLLVITGSSYMLKNTYADSNSVTHWNIGVAGQEDSVVADYENGTLTISGTGTMGSVYTDTSKPPNTLRWKDYANDITKVVIKGEITATDLSHMFYNLKYITAIEGLDKLDTSKVTDMSNMFDDCYALKELDVSHFDTSKVTDMSNMFNSCYTLKNLDVSSFNTSNVANMSNMFLLCQSLSKLGVSKFNTSKVTDMSNMFSYCQSLSELDVSHFGTSNVEDMYGMFYYCETLTELDVSNFNTSKVTDMTGMFSGCQSLSRLDVSHFDTSNVENMNSMFSSCYSLSELDVSKFDTGNVENMDIMFAACKSLNELDVSNFDTDNVTSMASMFENCHSLVKIKGFNITYKDNNVFSIFGYDLHLSQIEVKTKVSLKIPYIDDNHRWYDDQGNQLMSDGDNAVIPVSETYVTYTLKPGITYDINYNLDGGTLPEEAKDQFEILDEYELPIPVKSGYIFDGWYDSEDFDRSITKIEKNTTKDITVYAKWIGKTVIKADDFKVELSNETYTGNEITYTITSLLEGIGTTQVKKIEKNGVEVSKVKEAGTYKMTFDVAEADKYKSATVTKTFTISKATNSWKKALSIENWTYKEEANIPTSEAKFGEVKYTYSKKGLNHYTTTVPTTAGDWTVKATVIGTDNYKGIEATADFKIDKANGKISITSSQQDLKSIYNGQPFNKTVNVEKPADYTGTVTFKWEKKIGDSWEVLTEKPKDAGIYRVTAIAGADNNYKEALSKPVQFEIEKAEAPIITEPKNLSGGEGQKLSTVALSNGWKWLKDDTVLIADQTKYQAYLEVDDSNYNYADIDGYNQNKHYVVRALTIIIKAQNEWKVSPSIDDWRYGEEAKEPTSEAKFGEVKYTYSDKKDGVFTSKVPTNAGTWYVKAQVNETSNYTGLEEVKEFNINKAIPTVEMPTNLKGIENQLLSTVGLPKGWIWVDGNIMLSVQNGGYKARLIVDDTNYDYTGVEGYNKENHYVERTLNVSIASKEAGSIQKEVKKGNNAPDVKISMTESQLANIVLTDEEKKAVEKGSDIKIVLTVDDATGQISIKDKTVIESVLGKMKIGQYLDVSLLKIINHEESRISQTKGVIRITIEIPESLRKANREFVMIRVHDGVATILKDMDNNKNTITIETDRFSTYAIAYQDKQSDIAETEDRTVIGGYIILAGLAGMLLFINRKQKRI